MIVSPHTVKAGGSKSPLVTISKRLLSNCYSWPSRKSILTSNGFFCISFVRSCSFRANRALPSIFWASAMVKQSGNEMALVHFVFDASLISVRVSSTLRYPDANSLFTLSFDSLHPRLLQSTYLSSAIAISLVQASTTSLSRAFLRFCPGASQ